MLRKIPSILHLSPRLPSLPPRVCPQAATLLLHVPGGLLPPVLILCAADGFVLPELLLRATGWHILRVSGHVRRIFFVYSLLHVTAELLPIVPTVAPLLALYLHPLTQR